MGGMYLPLAEQQINAVTSCPLSAEVMDPTCFFPFVEMTLDRDFCTDDIPVLSQFHILSTPSFVWSTTFSSNVKKASADTLLNPIARAADVAPAFRRDSSWKCLSINPLYQSFSCSAKLFVKRMILFVYFAKLKCQSPEIHWTETKQHALHFLYILHELLFFLWGEDCFERTQS